MNMQLRALVGSRVSVFKGPHKVSHIAQTESGVSWAAKNDARVVAQFEDLDVSATISPFDRPDLGPWLTDEQAFAWDVIVWAKIDRAFRDPADSIAVAKWCEKRQKLMVFADDGLVLDFRPSANQMARMMAEMFLLVGSMFAKWELNRFRGRAEDVHRTLRQTDRYAGGVIPEGFMTAPHPSGKGRALVQDPMRQKMLHEAKKFFCEGKQSFNGVAGWLMEQGYETTRDYRRPKNEKRGTRWSAAQVVGMFTSLGTQGWKMQGSGDNIRPVLDEQGNMIRMASPTFTDAEWRELQQAVQVRRYGPKQRVNGASPLGDVVWCGRCGSKGRHQVTHHGYGTYRYYKCGRTPKACVGTSMNAEQVEILLEQTFLTECGESRLMVKVFEAGEDHTADLERVNQTIESLREDRRCGLFRGEDDEQRFRSQMAGLLTQRERLEALPQRGPGWRFERSDRTYAEEWRDADVAGRRRLLLDAGVRFLLIGKEEWAIEIPDDIKSALAKSH